MSDWSLLGLEGPVPGEPAGVQTMVAVFGRIGSESEDGATRLHRLMDDAASGTWQGDAATAFQNAIDHDLADNLDRISIVFTGMARVLDGWRPRLEWAQWRMNGLAAEAQQAYDAMEADQRAAIASGTPWNRESNAHFQRLQDLRSMARDVIENHYVPEVQDCRRQLEQLLSGSYSDDLGTGYKKVTGIAETVVSVVVHVVEGFVHSIVALGTNIEKLAKDWSDGNWMAVLDDVKNVVEGIGAIACVIALACTGVGALGLLGAAAVEGVLAVTTTVSVVTEAVTAGIDSFKLGYDLASGDGMAGADALNLAFDGAGLALHGIHGVSESGVQADASLQEAAPTLADAQANVASASQMAVATSSDAGDLSTALSSVDEAQKAVDNVRATLDGLSQGPVVSITNTVSGDNIVQSVNLLGQTLPGTAQFWAGPGGDAIPDALHLVHGAFQNLVLEPG